MELDLAAVRTDHLRTLVDDVGIIQHANGVIPNWETGYCVDDVARLATVALELSGRTLDREWTPVLHRSVAFLQYAAGPPGTGMRNFMGYDRRWLDEPHPGDHVGRTIWTLGEILSTAWIPALYGPSRSLLATLVPSLSRAVSIRTAAYAVLGLARLDPDRLDRDARLLLERLVDQLGSAYRKTASGSWLWFEDQLRYDNARLSQALIVGGSALRRPGDVALGLESLAWLGDECGLQDGVLVLPGHEGRDRDEPAPGAGDEQPLDAAALVEAELAALAVTGDPEHGSRARSSYDWFLGRNKLDRPLYDFATGGCSDGLGESDLNANEGAESTLAFHRATLMLDGAALPAVTRRRKPRAKVA